MPLDDETPTCDPGIAGSVRPNDAGLGRGERRRDREGIALLLKALALNLAYDNVQRFTLAGAAHGPLDGDPNSWDPRR
jgi:hypothetical protein